MLQRIKHYIGEAYESSYTAGMQSPLRRQLVGLILPVYMPMLLMSFAVALPSAVFPQYLVSLGAGIALSGVVLSLNGFGNLLTDLPGGLLIGRLPIGNVMSVSLAVAIAANIALALSRSVAAASVWILLTGASTSVMVTACMTFVRRTVNASNRGRAISLIGGSVRVGALLGPVVGGVLTDTLGYPSVFWMRAAALGMGLVVFLAGGRRSQPEAEATPTVSAASSAGSAATGRRSFREQLRMAVEHSRDRRGAVLIVGLGIVVLQLLRTTRGIALPLWGESLGLSASLIGSVMSLGAAVDLVLFIPAGHIMDRAGRRVAGSICTGIFSAGLLTLALSTGVTGYVAAALLIGLGNGFGAGINMTIGTDLAPNQAISEFLGAWRLIGDVGSTAGPAVAGAVIAAAGLLSGGLVISGIGFVGFLVFAFVAPETLEIARRDDRAAGTTSAHDPPSR